MRNQKLDIFNAFAHRLAKGGIASLRFDKRGCGASEGDYFTAGHHDFVHDVLCWHDSLHRAEFCLPEQLFLLGHSEGCLVAAHASLRRPNIAGLVLLCPFIERMENILIRQARQLEGELDARTGETGLLHVLITWLKGGPLASQRRLIRKVKNSTKPSILIWFQKVPAKWLRELLNIDASNVFSKISCPMLLVAGEKDLQCDPTDVSRIAALAHGPVEQHVIPNMTHLLRCDNEPPTLLGSHRLLAQPVETDVLELVSEWLRSKSASVEYPTNID